MMKKIITWVLLLCMCTFTQADQKTFLKWSDVNSYDQYMEVIRHIDDMSYYSGYKDDKLVFSKLDDYSKIAFVLKQFEYTQDKLRVEFACKLKIAYDDMRSKLTELPSPTKFRDAFIFLDLSKELAERHLSFINNVLSDNFEMIIPGESFDSSGNKQTFEVKKSIKLNSYQKRQLFIYRAKIRNIYVKFGTIANPKTK